jgi:hypothetical protein
MDFSQFYKQSQSTSKPKKPEKPKPGTEQKLQTKYYKNQNLERLGLAVKHGKYVTSTPDLLNFIFDFYKEINESYKTNNSKARTMRFLRSPRVMMALMQISAHAEVPPQKLVNLFIKTYLASLIYLVKNNVKPRDLSSLESFLSDKLNENPLNNYPNKEELGHYVTAESRKTSERRAV